MTAEPRRTGGLGRGLAALIPQRDDRPASIELPIAAIRRNPYQPRQAVDQQHLDELAASIAEHGVLQPILVTQAAEGYQLIAGERRLRAAQMAGLDRIPALVRTAERARSWPGRSIENLQRSDLNAIDEARAFRQLVDEFGLTHEDVGARVGRSRPRSPTRCACSTSRRAFRPALMRGPVSPRATRGPSADWTIGRSSRQRRSPQVISQGLSVRQTEELVRRRIKRSRPPPSARAQPARDPDVERLERGLREALATKVTLSHRRARGARSRSSTTTRTISSGMLRALTGGAA